MRVIELSTSAIKGFGLVHPETLSITPAGAEGDRAFYLVEPDGSMAGVNYDGNLLDWWSRFDSSTNEMTIGQGSDVVAQGAVMIGSPISTTFFAGREQSGRLVEGGWSALISEFAGRELRLVRAGNGLGGKDVEPVSMAAATSVAAIGKEGNGRPLDTARFRMNITIAGAPPFEEETWIGAQVRVGTTDLRIVSSVPRCAMVQRRAGDQGREIPVLRMMALSRGSQTSTGGRALLMGIYGRVETPGVVAVGDAVEVTEA